MKRVVITATPAMSQETYEFICAKIEEKYGEIFEFSRIDDMDIIGGFILNIENKFYDLSTRTRLNEIGEHILK